MTVRNEDAIDCRVRLTRSGEALFGFLSEGDDVADGWTGRLEDHLNEVGAALGVLSDAVDGGLYAEVLDTAPRLEGVVRRLRDEQDVLQQQVATNLSMIEQRNVYDAAGARNALTSVAARVQAHAHRAVGVVYDAYDTDLGGPG